MSDPLRSVSRRASGRRLAAAMLLAMLLAPAVAYACRCVPLTPAAAYRAADMVALVRVEAMSDRDPLARRWRLAVERRWKGAPSGAAPAIITVRSDRTDCLAVLEPGRRYLVYLDQDRAGLSTDACSGNLPADRAAAALADLRRRGR